MMPLAGQRILLIGIGFYDYETAIADAFRALGAEVRVENEQPPAMRGRLAPLRRRLGRDMAEALDRHRAAMLARARTGGALDHVVVIKGTLLDAPFLHALREAQPGARLTAYHWDSMARFPELRLRQALFDRVLTFDHADAARDPQFILRPLFYRPELDRHRSAAGTIDLSFVGWLHHDRLRQVETIRDQARALGLTTSLYLTTGSWTRLKLRLAGRGRDVHARPQGFGPYVATTAASCAILDLPHPEQTGLTMRAIETVGVGRKLITTAADVGAYDFYRPENIRILDPRDLRIDPVFLRTSPAPVPPEIVERYSLRAWALDVLGVTTPAAFLRRPPAPAADRAALSAVGLSG